MIERYRGERVVNGPNAITALRVVGALRHAYRYQKTGQFKDLLATGGYFSGDVVDGWLARKLQKTTQFGGDLDKVGDKLTDTLLFLGGLRQGSADRIPLALVGVVDASNILATLVGIVRGNTPEQVPNINRLAQAGMNYGTGFNMIGNHLRKSADRSTRAAGEVIRYSGAIMAGGSAATLGVASSIQLWKTVLQAEQQSTHEGPGAHLLSPQVM